MKNIFSLFIISISIVIESIECGCLTPNPEKTTMIDASADFNRVQGHSRTIEKLITTTSVPLISTTINMNYVCLYNTGYRLNETALSQLSLIDSQIYQIDQKECCSLCNANSQCDYAFEVVNQKTSITTCRLYHWNIPDGMTTLQLAIDVKAGLWFERKLYTANSGRLIFPNEFIRLISSSNL